MRPLLRFTHPIAISVVLVAILMVYCVVGTAIVLFIKHFW